MRFINRPPCPNPEALKNNYKNPENKRALEEASYGKCMYCESKVTHIYYGDVEHIKPKATGKYPELQFDWLNLGYCCALCNNAKRDQYEDDCPFIDPYREDPAKYFVTYGGAIFPKNGSERGEFTIIAIDLNRGKLVERRAMMIKELQEAIAKCHRTQSPALRQILLDKLKEAASDDKEFSMFAAIFLEIHDR